MDIDWLAELTIQARQNASECRHLADTIASRLSVVVSILDGIKNRHTPSVWKSTSADISRRRLKLEHQYKVDSVANELKKLIASLHIRAAGFEQSIQNYQQIYDDQQQNHSPSKHSPSR